MQPLEPPAREAVEPAQGAVAQGGNPGGVVAKGGISEAAVPPGIAAAEAARQMRICNACRYCEGFCAVFPAMTRRLEFGQADIDYLANLCHNCGACLHACQYAPPHEFEVNVPQAMAKVRLQTYSDHAWPRALGRLYRHHGLTLALALAAGLALFPLLAMALNGTLWQGPLSANFYRVFPHTLMVSLFAPIFLFAVLALALGGRGFWNSISPADRVNDAPRAALAEATRDALLLKYLDGGHGKGCNEADDAFTLWRRRFHHFTFYGFLLCFASTAVAALYHAVFGWEAPYALASLPVLLGIAGGVGLLIGPAGLLWLNLGRHPLHGDAAQKTMDRGFIALLLLASASGIALLAWRASGAMAPLLALHLGIVMALFVTLPYGKFAHCIHRAAALLKWAIEKRRPNRSQTGSGSAPVVIRGAKDRA